MSKTILLIDKAGVLKEITVKPEQMNELHKKAGFKTADGFTERFVWEIQLDDVKYSISLYAKKNGRNVKNTFDFPPPLEETEFFGNCLLVNHFGSLTIYEWNTLYELIYDKYGEKDDDEEADDDAEDAAVDDEEEGGAAAAEEEEDDVEEDEDDDEETAGKSKKKSGGGRKKGKKSKRIQDDDDLLLMDEDYNQGDELYLDCTMELEPEMYLE